MDVGGRLSVIVPVYNGENYLEICLNGLITQTYDNLEIVLVDDGSTDRTWEIANDMLSTSGRIHYITKTNGPSRCTPCTLLWPLYVGMGNSTGQYASIQTHDNLSDPKRFEYTMEYIFRDNFSHIPISLSTIINENGDELGPGNGQLTSDK